MPTPQAHRSYRTGLLALAALLTLAACGGGSTTTRVTGSDVQRVGMANPASVYCAEHGGRMEMRSVAGGTAGYCHLRNGTVMEEWQLYREASSL